MRGTIESRFWAKVQKSDGCWTWTGAKTEHGYGVLGLGSRTDGVEKAHRVSWAIHFGAPGSQHVLHRCDNPGCVRPDHLFLGDAKANSDDKWSKGRASAPPVHRGLANTRARLVEWRGERKCLAEWSTTTGIKAGTLQWRIARGWPLERVFGAAA